MSSKQKVLQRNVDALWRKNSDGTVLVLLEKTGGAFILSGLAAFCWELFDGGADVPGPDVSYSSGKSQEELRTVVGNVVQVLCDEDLLIESEDYPGSRPQVAASFVQQTNCSLEHLIVRSQNYEGTVSADISQIEFGACDCSVNGRGWRRNLYCYNNNVPKIDASIVIV
jgi:hypothetical protein